MVQRRRASSTGTMRRADSTESATNERTYSFVPIGVPRTRWPARAVVPEPRSMLSARAVKSREGSPRRSTTSRRSETMQAREEGSAREGPNMVVLPGARTKPRGRVRQSRWVKAKGGLWNEETKAAARGRVEAMAAQREHGGTYRVINGTEKKGCEKPGGIDRGGPRRWEA